MYLSALVLSALVASAFGARCESRGGECRRNCAGGEWDFGLTCENSNRMCCFQSGAGEATDPPTVTDPPAAVNPADIPGQENCGVANLNRIVSGQEAQQHEWPWQVSLWLIAYDMHFCGGTLVSDQWVVTAAHCVTGNGYDKPTDLRVLLGEHHLTNVAGTEVYRDVAEIIVHENYRDRDPWPHDIALLRLASPVNLGGRTIKTACLPRSDDEFTAADDCWITGWGDSKGTANENILQEIRAEIRTNADCEAAWGKGSILEGHICNSDGSSGSCSGDSGGPLQCSKNGRYHLVGVVSWGTSTCTTPGYPGVYTRMTSYTGWVYNQIMSYQQMQKKSRYD